MRTVAIKPIAGIRKVRTGTSSFSYIQTVNMAMGCLMNLIGLAGLLYSEFMGMHLSPIHCLVLCSTGCLAIWMSTHSNYKQLFWLSMILGGFYAINAGVGFFLGSLGDPGVGYRAPDALLIKIAPGFIELGLVDHCVHAFLSLFFFTGALSSKKRVPPKI